MNLQGELAEAEEEGGRHSDPDGYLLDLGDYGF
jgi:hypothetical protein